MEEPVREGDACERALELMREALCLLDTAGRPIPAAHLAHAIDLLRNNGDTARGPGVDR